MNWPSAVGFRLISTRNRGFGAREFDAGINSDHFEIRSHSKRSRGMRDFRRLQVWQYAHRLTLGVYQHTARFPKDEIYGLRSQIRRGASSIAANLAEASGRRTDRDQARFVDIAMGSACELEYHLLLARDLHFIADGACTQLLPILESVKRMLTIFARRLRADSRPPTASSIDLERTS
jgi:four helix bundle protein